MSAKTLPSREDILAFITRERDAGRGDKIGKREIARAFGLSGADKIGLKAVLRELEGAGRVERRRKGLSVPGTLPPVVLADVVRIDDDGELIATPAEWDETQSGPLPRILLHRPRRPKAGDVAPGIGDRVLARTDPLRDSDEHGPRYTGRVIKVLSKTKTRVLGIFRIGARGARIEPVEKKQVGREYLVAQADRGDAQDGDLVAVEVMRGGRFGPTQARVREVVGSLASEKAVSLIALHAHNIPDAFRADTLAEAQAARPTTLEAEGFAREDWRDVPLVTIDPPDAKDHDDAVFAMHDDDPANPGGFVVTVAIADVSFYVRPDSALDREALVRGNSVYFPDRVVPMLPEEISNDLCSLVPLKDRPALAVKLVVAADGRKKRHSFHRVMMRSHAKLAYAQAQAAFDGQADATAAPLVDSVLRPLLAAYECARLARQQRAPLDLDLPERKILLKEDGTVDRVVVPPRLEAHRLIEEFMILANVAAAETLEERRQRLVYRAPRRAERGKADGPVGVSGDNRREARKGSDRARGNLQHDPRAHEGHGTRKPRQRGRAAGAGASRIHRRELRAFWP